MKRLIIICAALGLILAVSGVAQAYMYAGTSNDGRVYLYSGSGTTWTPISGSLGYAVLDIIGYQGQLYASTMSTSSPTSGIGKVWRWDGGTSWTQVGPNMDDQVASLEVYGGELYAGTAWNGGKLYQYNSGTDSFGYVGAVSNFSGIRSMYASSYNYLQLGDIGNDYFGHYDGSSLTFDQSLGGSCIYDFAEFNGALYGAAYMGRLLSSTNGTSWSVARGNYDGNMWELEPFQGDLYMSYDNGVLAKLDTSNNWTSVLGAQDSIISMVADGAVLYYGIGGEAGAYYGSSTSGTGYVYAYDGTNATLISGAMGTGVQTLYETHIIPAPAAVLLGILGLGAAGLKLRKFA